MSKRYVVRLSEEERKELQSLVKKGTVKAYRVKHANILLKADANGPGWTDEKIAEAFGCHFNTVVQVRRRLVEEGLERALGRKKQQRLSREKSLDGEQEAQMIALSCGPPPEGRARWTLRLLSQRLVEMEIVETISHETVRQALKKRPQTALEEVLGDPAPAECGLRGPYGRRSGSLQASLGWEISGGVHGRAAAAVDWRNSPADPARRGGAGRALRLRI